MIANPIAAETALADVAFGADPGRWPLPVPTSAHGLWLRAVAAGGQGRYGAALTDLAAVTRLTGARTSPEVSLAHSTRASLLRQLGGHARARGWDGRALSIATTPDARADALIGLAADALGVGRFAASARLLQCAADVHGVSERVPVRRAWVSAELAMARGDGSAAVRPATRAVELADAFGSARHAVKSAVVLAAARCSAGQLDQARATADAALESAGRLGLVPLSWALACLLADIGSDTHTSAQVTRIRDDCADTVRRRGGQWFAR